METQHHNEATPNRPEGSRDLDASLLKIDLQHYSKQIKEEDAWQKNDRNAITLFKSEGMRLVLVALHKDAVMDPHTAPGNISVQVLEGKITFSASGTSHELTPGQVVTLHKGIQHSVTAMEESIFLLTMAIHDKSSIS